MWQYGREPSLIGGTTRQRWFRELLRRALESEGFEVYRQEWHFDYKGWSKHGIGTVSVATTAEAARRDSSFHHRS